MQTFKKRIYAFSSLLLLVLGFNIFAYQYNRTRVGEQTATGQILQELSILQSQSEDIAQLITTPSVPYPSTEQESLVKQFTGHYTRLLKAIHERRFAGLTAPALLEEELRAIQPAYQAFIACTTPPGQHASPHGKQVDLIRKVRIAETDLQKRLQSITRTFYAIQNANQKLILQLNRSVNMSLFITLLALILLLVLPAIRLHMKHYQQLQRTLQEAKQSEALLRTVIDSSPDFIFILDKDQKYRMVNKALSESLNIPAAAFIGKDDLELGLPADMILGDPAKGIRGLWTDNREVMETGLPKHIPEEVLHLNGSRRIVSMTKTPIREGTTQPFCLLGFAHDITDRVQAQELVLGSEKKYRYLFEYNPLPMWIYDMATLQFLEVNQMAVQHYGYSYEEFLSMNICEIRPAHELPRLRKLVATCSAGYDEVRLRGTWEHKKKNGDRIYVSILSHNIVYNNRPAVLILANDVTQEKELQQALMEEKITRQKAIAKAALDVQEKERNEIGSELHDNVNQILTAAKLYIGFMMEETSTEHLGTTKDLISMAVEEIRRISRVFAPPCLKNTGFIFSIQSLLQNIEITTGIQTSIDHEDFQEDLVEDSLKLTIYRIIQEATTNIIKYAAARHIRIALLPIHDTISLKITDDGIGFDMTEPIKGTGITNMINRVEIYQGRMQICSAPGKGCVVTVEFALPGAAAPR